MTNQERLKQLREMLAAHPGRIKGFYIPSFRVPVVAFLCLSSHRKARPRPRSRPGTGTRRRPKRKAPRVPSPWNTKRSHPRRKACTSNQK
jgi:hypothetical protein